MPCVIAICLAFADGIQVSYRFSRLETDITEVEVVVGIGRGRLAVETDLDHLAGLVGQVETIGLTRGRDIVVNEVTRAVVVPFVTNEHITVL